MKISRIMLGALLALALLLTQIAPLTDARPPANCGCGLANCCCCPTPHPGSAPQPAAPSRAVTRDLQLVAAVVEQVISIPARARPSVFHSLPALQVSPIPLYQRDCVRLI